MKKESLNLKESKEGYLGGIGGSKGREGMMLSYYTLKQRRNKNKNLKKSLKWVESQRTYIRNSQVHLKNISETLKKCKYVKICKFNVMVYSNERFYAAWMD